MFCFSTDACSILILEAVTFFCIEDMENVEDIENVEIMIFKESMIKQLWCICHATAHSLWQHVPFHTLPAR